MIRLTLAIASIVVVSGCGSCHGKPKPEPPASRHDLDLVDQALTGDYKAAITELEKQPAAGLRAVREMTAPRHSRKALYLAVIADHLQHVDSYHAWQKQFRDSAPPETTPLGPKYSTNIPGLGGQEHLYFWGEQMINQQGELARAAAIAHLAQIGGDTAGDLIALDVRTPSGSSNFAGLASDALAHLGRGRDIAEGLAALQHSSLAPSAVPEDVATLQASLRKMSPDVRARTEAELLGALETESLTTDQRAGYLITLGTIGSSAAVDRLAAFRQAPWGVQMKAEIDAASAQILAREDDAPKGSAKP